MRKKNRRIIALVRQMVKIESMKHICTFKAVGIMIEQS